MVNDESTTDATVTDPEIQEIMDQGEAGITDLIAAYEPIEQQYFNAVQGTTGAVVTYSTTTTQQY